MRRFRIPATAFFVPTRLTISRIQQIKLQRCNKIILDTRSKKVYYNIVTKKTPMIEPKPQTVLELFENHPERWTQGVAARDANNGGCETFDGCAVCWCLSAAIELVYAPPPGKLVAGNCKPFWTALEKVREQIENRYFFANIVDFNDGKRRADAPTTFDEVLAIVREAGV